MAREELDEFEDLENPPPPVKRPRGRPRKHPLPAQTEDSEIFVPVREETPEERDLDLLLSDLPASEDVIINVYRQTTTHELSHLFSFIPGEYSFPQLMEKLRTEYHGGRFRLHCRVEGRMKFNKFVSVEGVPRKTLNEESIANLIEQKLERVAPVQNNSSDLARVIEAMQAGFNQLGQLLVQQKSESELEDRFMNRMVQMRGLFAPVNGNTQEREGNIDVFLKGLEMGKSIIDSAGAASEFDVLKEGIKAVGPALTQAFMGGNQSPGTPRPAMYAPAPANRIAPPSLPAASIPQPLEETVDRNMELVLKAYLNRLIKAAQKGSDPYGYAVQVIDDVPEATIREFLSTPDSFAKVTQLVPEAANVKEWFEDLATEVSAILNGEYDEPEEEEAPPAPPQDKGAV